MSAPAAPGPGGLSVARPPAPAEPYPGLEPFRFADSGIFAARDAEVERLVRLITMYRGVLLYGESGAGKSSVVNAGLLTRLIEDDLWPHRVRVQPLAGQELVLDPVRLSWADDALLPSAFEGAVSDGQAVLAAGTLNEAVEAATSKGRILLVFDQFEELITLFDGDADALAAQARVLDAVLRLLRNPSLPVKLLFVFREDYLAALEPLIAEKPELSDQALRLVPPPVECATQIIRAPFERFPDAFYRELSPEVAERVAGALAARSRAGALNLSELQVVCRRLWEAPDAAALLDTQGVEGLLEDFLKAGLARFDDERVGDLAVALLTRLVTVSSTRNVVSYDDLVAQGAEEASRSPELARAVLHRLEHESHLVRSERRRDVLTYEIVSEFLVPFIAARKADREAARDAREALEASEAAHKADLARRRGLLLRIGGSLALVAMILIIALAVYAWNQRSAALHDSQAAKDSARVARDSARIASANELASAADALKSRNPGLAQRLALEGLARGWTPVAENALRTAISIPSSRRTLALVKRKALDYYTSAGLVLSADGGSAASVAGEKARVWDARTGALRMETAKLPQALGVRLSRDGGRLLVTTAGGLRVYDVATGRQRGKFALGRYTAQFSSALSDDGSLVDVEAFSPRSGSGVRRLYSVADGKRIPRTPTLSEMASAQLSPDGRALFGYNRNGFEVWNSTPARKLWGARRAFVAAASPDSQTLAIAARGRLDLRRLQTGGVIRRMRDSESVAVGLEFAAGGGVLIAQRYVSPRRTEFSAWSVKHGRRIGPPIRVRAAPPMFAVSPDGSLLATLSAGDVTLWDTRTGASIAKLHGAAGGSAAAAPFAAAAAPAAAAPAPAAPAPAVLPAAPAPARGAAGEAAAAPVAAAPAPVPDIPGSIVFTDAGELLTAGSDGTLRAWDLTALRPQFVVRDHWARPLFSPSGDQLALVGADGNVRVRSLPDGALEYTLHAGPHRAFAAAAFDRAGTTLLTATRHGEIDRRDARRGEQVTMLRRELPGRVFGARFSDDGRHVLVATSKLVVELDVADGRILYKRRSGGLLGFAYGRGRRMALSDWESRVLVLDAAQPSKPLVIQSAHGVVFSLAYSRDGQLLAGGTESGAAVVWDARSGRELAVLDAGNDYVGTVEFTQDGRRLLTANNDGNVRFFNWKAQSGALLASSNDVSEHVSLSPDLRDLALAGEHGATMLVRCPGCALLAPLKATANRTAPQLSNANRKKYLHEGTPPKQDPY